MEIELRWLVLERHSFTGRTEVSRVLQWRYLGNKWQNVDEEFVSTETDDE